MDFSLDLATEQLRSTQGTLRALLQDRSDAWLEADEGPGTWTPWQVLGHLTSIEETDWLDRTRVILEHGTSHPFEPVDREAGFVRFAGWPAAKLLDRFGELRADNLAAVDELVSDADLARRGIHPDFGEVTLAQLLATWTVHDLNHLGQIVAAMAKQYRDAIGPWRAFLPIVDRT